MDKGRLCNYRPIWWHIWGYVFYLVFTLINSGASFQLILTVFISVFVILAIVNRDIIGNAGLGALYVLLGTFCRSGDSIPISDLLTVYYQCL